MKHPLPIEYNKYYNIYNRGINGEDLFREPSNYMYFMDLFFEYVDPVCEIFAWVLMRNHFHFLVRILDAEEIDFMKPRSDKIKIIYPSNKKYNPTRQFGNLFNAYAKAYNKKFERTGSLFESPFRRVKVENERYFKQLIYYIHNNPVHHGFCETMIEYPWSSYLTMVSVNPTKLQRDKVIGWFNSVSEFIEYHRENHKREIIESIMIE